MGTRVAQSHSRKQLPRVRHFWTEWGRDMLAVLMLVATVFVGVLLAGALPARADEPTIEIIEASSSALYPAPSAAPGRPTGLPAAVTAVVEISLAETGSGDLILVVFVGGSIVFGGALVLLGARSGRRIGNG